MPDLVGEQVCLENRIANIIQCASSSGMSNSDLFGVLPIRDADDRSSPIRLEISPRGYTEDRVPCH